MCADAWVEAGTFCKKSRADELVTARTPSEPSRTASSHAQPIATEQRALQTFSGIATTHYHGICPVIALPHPPLDQQRHTLFPTGFGDRLHGTHASSTKTRTVTNDDLASKTPLQIAVQLLRVSVAALTKPNVILVPFLRWLGPTSPPCLKFRTVPPEAQL